MEAQIIQAARRGALGWIEEAAGVPAGTAIRLVRLVRKYPRRLSDVSQGQAYIAALTPPLRQLVCFLC